ALRIKDADVLLVDLERGVRRSGKQFLQRDPSAPERLRMSRELTADAAALLPDSGRGIKLCEPFVQPRRKALPAGMHQKMRVFVSRHVELAGVEARHDNVVAAV